MIFFVFTNSMICSILQCQLKFYVTCQHLLYAIFFKYGGVYYEIYYAGPVNVGPV
jgi:hypothetical protein